MLVLAVRTLRDRASAFVGAFVAAVLGTAMLTAAVAVMTSAASAPVTGEAREALDGVSSVIGFMAALAAFLSVFIVSSTFAFAVASRARELALLRMVGATPKQVRRLVRTESLLVGVLAAVLGCLLGLPLGLGLAGFLVLVGVAPVGFTLSFSGPTWYVAVPISFVVGVLVTWLGAGSAAKRASLANPSDALREADVDERVMTRKRWVLGSVFLVLGIAGVAVLPVLAGDVQIPIAVFLAQPFVVAAVLFSPLFIGGLSSWFVRDRSATGTVARANLRVGARRTTSTAAPITLAVGICGSLLGVSLVMAAAGETSLRQSYVSDLVVEGGGATADEIRRVPGVEEATTIGHTRVRAVVADGAWDQPVEATVVEPETMLSALRLDEFDGSPDRLHGPSVALGRNLAWSMGWELGGEYSVRMPDGSEQRVRVVGLYRDSALIQSMLLPNDFVAAETSSVHVSAIEESDRVRAAVGQRWPDASVTSTEEWLEPLVGERNGGMRSGVWLLSGFALVYTLLAIANTTAMTFRSRSREFTSLRLVGARVDQVRELVRSESIALGAAGALVGGLIALATSLAVWFALRASVPDTPFVLPIFEVLVLSGACVVMVIAASRAAMPRSEGGRVGRSRG